MNYVVGFIDKLGVLGRTCVVSCFEEVEQVLWILYDQNGDVNDLIIAKGENSDCWYEREGTHTTEAGTYFVGALETLEELDAEEVFE